MRIRTWALALALACGVNSCVHRTHAPAAAPPPVIDAVVQEAESPAPPAPIAPKIDFATQVKPILESRCQPCHFKGGIMYERLPFDRPETINTLGTKVFGRIKDEDELALIRDYLSQQSETSQPRS